jgi:hypothetical protein
VPLADNFLQKQQKQRERPCTRPLIMNESEHWFILVQVEIEASTPARRMT